MRGFESLVLTIHRIRLVVHTIGTEKMLRMDILRTWFNLSDSAMEDATYGSYAMRKFADIDSMKASTPEAENVQKSLSMNISQKVVFALISVRAVFPVFPPIPLIEDGKLDISSYLSGARQSMLSELSSAGLE